MKKSLVRVRYAPSPTGYLHLGGLRTALFNYLYAKKENGVFILRIEDTDQSRHVPGATAALSSALKWCGITPDEGPGSITDVVGPDNVTSQKPGEIVSNQHGRYGPYIQSQRLHLYQSYATQLIESGHGYYCFCCSDRLSRVRQGQLKRGEATKYDGSCRNLSQSYVTAQLAAGASYTIRLRVPDTGSSTVHDAIRGYVSFAHSGIDDQVLMKSDGFPTYHLASVVDDHLMDISHVIRGEEWLNSTPKHVLLYNALSFPLPTFAHLGLLLNTDRSKLSKRQGDVAVEDFKNKGFTKEGLLNFTALLGWNPSKGETQEIFSLTELEERFCLQNVNKSGSIVNIDRMRWINGQHIRKLVTSDSKNLLEQVVLDLQNLDPNNEELRESLRDTKRVYAVVELMKEKVSVISEFTSLCGYFFQRPNTSLESIQIVQRKYWNPVTDTLLQHLKTTLKSKNAQEFNAVRSWLLVF